MTQLFFAGDCHGNIKHCEYIIQMCKGSKLQEIYQLGDFGYWEHEFFGVKFLDNLNSMLVEAGIKLYWIDGNHENHEMLREVYGVDGPGEYVIRSNIIHIGRGTVKEFGGKKFLFVGGAVSIDRRSRSPYISWWPQEILSTEDINNVVDVGQVDALISHDAPLGDYFLTRMLGPGNNTMYPDSYLHRQVMSGIVEAVKPKLIVHGHYHVYYRDTLIYGKGPGDRTKIIGVAEDGTGYDSWQIIDTDHIR